MHEFANMSVTMLAQAIGDGQLDPIELSNSYLSAIEAHEFGDQIYTMALHDRAVAEAKAAAHRAKLGVRLGPLDGIPISWKDLFDTAGLETSAGSMLLAGRVPVRDCAVLETAVLSGCVTLGKTHMSELAFSGLGLNPVTQTPPCINDLAAVPGGSSSGAGASVAFGLAPAAIGSDTGGSVRIPAAWNDLVGLKTTVGRLNMQGVVPLCPNFDSIGPLTKTVEDAALIFATLVGQKPIDMMPKSLRGQKFAVLMGEAQNNLRDAPCAAFEQAIDALKSAGAQIVEIAIPEADQALGLSGVLYAAEAYGTWKHLIEKNPNDMFHEILTRFRTGRDVLASDYIAAWQKLEKLRASYLQKTREFDAVILPTSPILPPNRDRLLTDNDYYVTENLFALRNTRIGNLMGLCALTLPTGVPSCGVSLMASPFEEERLLRLGLSVQAALS